MNNYKHFKLEDFVSDDEFISWCLHPNERSNKFWNNWLEEHPEKEFLVLEAKQFILDLKSIETEASPSNLELEIWEQIENNLIQEKKPNKLERKAGKFRSLRWVLGAAASLLLILNIFLWLQVDSFNKVSNNLSKAEWLNIENSSGISKTIHLSDNSSIILEPFSSLKYPASFSNDQRVVFLKGEAFFEIERDTSRPFLVYANETITKVLGTSFRITAFEGQEIVEVDVTTGKVAVYGHVKSNTLDPQEKMIEVEADEKILISKPNKKLEVTPNQKVVFNKKASMMVKEVTATPLIISKIEALPQLEFENESIVKVFEAIEKAYGIELEFSEEELDECTITTKLNNESLFDKLNIICTALDLSFSEKEAKIFIKGKGCNE